MKRWFSILVLACSLPTMSLSSCNRDTSAAEGQQRNVSADVAFAKSAFADLASGELTAVAKIDWPTLQWQGTNVGAEYAAMKNVADRDEFRANFVRQFSSAFIKEGGKLENFTEWRATESDALKTVVGASSPAGLLKLTVIDREQERKISGIEVDR